VEIDKAHLVVRVKDASAADAAAVIEAIKAAGFDCMKPEASATGTGEATTPEEGTSDEPVEEASAEPAEPAETTDVTPETPADEMAEGSTVSFKLSGLR
jgi:hypothetical protein